MYKRILLILLTLIFLFAGAGAAADSAVLTVIVQDASNSYSGLAGAAVELTDAGGLHIASLSTDDAGKVQFSTAAGGRYTVTIQKTGYLTQRTDIIIDAGETNKLEIIPLSMEPPLTVIVKDTAGNLVPNAEIFVDNTRVGMTDSSGFCQIPVSRGKTYVFAVTHPSFENFSAGITVKDEPTDTIYLVKKDVAPYFFVTDMAGNKIEGASVSLAGDIAGITNADGIAALAPSAYSGKYPLVVSKEGFEPYTAEIEISSARSEYDIVLIPLTYTVTISVKSGAAPVSGAAVYIDEKLVAYSGPDGTAEALGTYSEGSHTLLVTSDGFAPIQQTVTVNTGNTKFPVDLSRTTIPVTVQVKEGDKPLSNVAVCIDGVMAGVTGEAGTFSAMYDIGRTIKITAIKDGYTCEPVTYTTVNGENNVSVVLSPDVPVTIIAVGALGILVVLLLVILVVTGLRKSKTPSKPAKKGKSSGKNSGRSSGGRDFL